MFIAVLLQQLGRLKAAPTAAAVHQHRRRQVRNDLRRPHIVQLSQGQQNGPGGVAVIVEALTDNRQRTAPEVRHAFDKCNGNLGAQGCVSWSFDRKGVIVIDNEDQELDEDTVMMDALEAGAADFEADGMVMEVRCEPDDFNTVVKALEDKGYTFLSADIAMVPQNYISLTDEGDLKNMQKLIDMLEDNDDVQNVWHNWEND